VTSWVEKVTCCQIYMAFHLKGMVRIQLCDFHCWVGVYVSITVAFILGPYIKQYIAISDLWCSQGLMQLDPDGTVILLATRVSDDSPIAPGSLITWVLVSTIFVHACFFNAPFCFNSAASAGRLNSLQTPKDCLIYLHYIFQHSHIHTEIQTHTLTPTHIQVRQWSRH
jgi:hypothetical protein